MQSQCYANDEDLVLRASTDFLTLCPHDQVIARGTDGTFSAIDRWTLSSRSVDFSKQGAKEGQVVWLWRPAQLFKPPGELLVVDRVDGTGAKLRRKGIPAGQGHPPSPPSGAEAVEFAIITLGPQLQSASADLNRRLGIDVNGPHDPSTIIDPSELREATLLVALHRLYVDASREADPTNDTLATKARRIETELQSTLGRLSVHFSTATGLESINLFRKRIVR